MKIFPDKNHVIFDFPSRGCCLQMTPDQATRVVEGIRKAANDCEAWMNGGGDGHLVKGRIIEIKHIKSWGGKVEILFAEYHKMLPVPYQMARKIADAVESRIIEAQYGLTIEWKPKYQGA